MMRKRKKSSMRRMHRIVLLATFVAVAPMLAGCADFDPDKLDVFGLNEKKKLPGERKPVFPEGVPGVTQGVPPEFIKGNQPPPDSAQTPPAAPDNVTAGAPSKQAAVTPVEEPKTESKPKPKQTAKRKPKPPAAAAAAPVQPVTQGAQQPAPWPAPAQGSSAAPDTAPWPAAPPPGTFTR